MCGEKLLQIRGQAPFSGSPPRVRGKANCGVWPFISNRITPACAGKSCWLSYGWSSGQDHPRVCGEKLIATYPPFVSPGSPPRVRGKALRIRKIEHAVGITPACAGKRGWRDRPDCAHRDHPRVCGEKFGINGTRVLPQGSPPRVRGKDRPQLTASLKLGITPACAGKSVFARHRAVPERDHPRVCGEKRFRPTPRRPRTGSPPRVRGKVCLFHTSALL